VQNPLGRVGVAVFPTGPLFPDRAAGRDWGPNSLYIGVKPYFEDMPSRSPESLLRRLSILGVQTPVFNSNAAQSFCHFVALVITYWFSISYS